MRLLPIAQFERARHDWDLVAAAAGGRPIQDHAFFSAALQTFGMPEGVVGVVHRGGPPVAAGLFVRGRLGCWTTFQPSQAPLGAWVTARDAPHDEVLRQLVARLPGPTLRLTLTQQDPSLFDFGTSCPRAVRTGYIETGSIAIEGSFEDYWQRCSGNLRENMKKQTNRLTRLHQSSDLVILRTPDEVERGVSEYGMLESQGWKATEGTAIHPGNAQGRFYGSLLCHFARDGEAIVFQYWIDGALAASDLCLMRSGTLYVLKTTYNENADKLSPALLMRTSIMRWLFEYSAVRSVEFYGRVMEWHRRFASDVRQLYHLDYYRTAGIRRAVEFALSMLPRSAGRSSAS